MSKILRVDNEVYAKLLEIKHRLEENSQTIISMSEVTRFLISLGELRIEEARDRHGN